MGGVKTDVDGATSIPGLYAAGEAACVSVHGGNRLGANSLLDTLIFGRRAGEHAAKRAHDLPLPEVSDAALADEHAMIDGILNRERTGRRVSEIKDELGTTMDKYAAVFRDAEGLAKAHEIVHRLREEAKSAYIDDQGTVFNQDVLGAIELGYLLDWPSARSPPPSSARSRAARSSAPTSPSATTTSGSSTSPCRPTAASRTSATRR